jgi:TIR domain
VTWFAEFLSLWGHRLWWDRWDLALGADLRQEISTGIEESGLVVVFWTKVAAESEWVRYEAQIALQQKTERGRPNVVFVRVDETPLPNDWGELKCVLAENAKDAAVQLFEFLGESQIETLGETPFVRVISAKGMIGYSEAQHSRFSFRLVASKTSPLAVGVLLRLSCHREDLFDLRDPIWKAFFTLTERDMQVEELLSACAAAANSTIGRWNDDAHLGRIAGGSIAAFALEDDVAYATQMGVCSCWARIAAREEAASPGKTAWWTQQYAGKSIYSIDSPLMYECDSVWQHPLGHLKEINLVVHRLPFHESASLLGLATKPMYMSRSEPGGNSQEGSLREFMIGNSESAARASNRMIHETSKQTVLVVRR